LTDISQMDGLSAHARQHRRGIGQGVWGNSHFEWKLRL